MNMQPAQFGKALLLATAMTGAVLASDGFNQKAQAQFANLTFACSNPGPGLEVFSGSANALIASPSPGLAEFPTHRTIAVFGNAAQASGRRVSGEFRCLQAMQILNTVANGRPAGLGLTFETLTDQAGTTTGATICLVPVQILGTRTCVVGSIVLFNIFPNTATEARAVDVIQALGGPGPFVPGVPMGPIVRGQL